MTTTIAKELSRYLKTEYLDSMSSYELAFWLVNSFTPERYRAGDQDVIEYACKLLYEKAKAPLMIVEFYNRLWGMHGLDPDPAPQIFNQNVFKFERK